MLSPDSNLSPHALIQHFPHPKKDLLSLPSRPSCESLRSRRNGLSLTRAKLSRLEHPTKLKARGASVDFLARDRWPRSFRSRTLNRNYFLRSEEPETNGFPRQPQSPGRTVSRSISPYEGNFFLRSPTLQVLSSESRRHHRRKLIGRAGEHRAA